MYQAIASIWLFNHNNQIANSLIVNKKDKNQVLNISSGCFVFINLIGRQLSEPFPDSFIDLTEYQFLLIFKFSRFMTLHFFKNNIFPIIGFKGSLTVSIDANYFLRMFQPDNFNTFCNSIKLALCIFYTLLKVFNYYLVLTYFISNYAAFFLRIGCISIAINHL